MKSYLGMSLITKMSPPLMLICSTYQVRTVPTFPKLLWKTLEMGENLPNSQRFTHSRSPEKPHLTDLHPPLSKVSLIPT